MKQSCRIGISNMHCSNCSMAVERHFNKLDGINVTVFLSENIGLFSYDDTIWNEKKIEKHLKDIGFPKTKDNEDRNKLIQMILCILIMLPFILHMILMSCDVNIKEYGYVQFVLASIVEILAGVPFALGMVKDIKNKSLGMDVLVTLGTFTAYIFSSISLFFNLGFPLYFHTSVMLLTILLIGKFIERKAKKKTALELHALMELQEHTAKVLVDDKIEIKNIKDIEENQVIVVSNGEKIPLDGIIINGSANIDENMLNGESIPAYKNINSFVFAGTMILNGNINIKVTKKYDDTYLSSLINKVESIQTSKPKIQKLADKIASIFVPVVLSLALISFLVAYLLLKLPLSDSICRAISVLMISCPCSLGLATPLAILVGSSRAIKMGIIYNNTEIFEKASHINTICFDKTGTLSKGNLIVSNATYSDNNALDIALSLESISNHPIAKAITNYCIANNAKLIKLDALEIIGVGIKAEKYFIYKKNNIVYLKDGQNIIASFEIKDEIKDNAQNIIAKFDSMNIASYMITGDNKDIALDVANYLNISSQNVFYEIRPEDKLNVIKTLQEKENTVAFVGDGINDSLALNQANLSIAMGNGSDIAKNCSDITISNNDLTNINKAIVLSKKVYRGIIENFIWAFSYNLVAIPLAFVGIINPMIAGICMAFSNLTVVFNSLRLFKVKVDK